jgi:hypothetical protein
LGEPITQHLSDSRRGKNTQLPLTDPFRQAVYSRIAGYEDVNGAERPAQDPTFRLIGSEEIRERGAALTSRLHTFETGILAEQENFAGLARINRELIGKAEAVDSPQRVVLDMDSTEIPVYGQQENSAYNGHFESTCYHPLLLFNREGDCLAAKLRSGNVYSADDWEEVLLPEIERQQKLGKEVVFRARPRGRRGLRQAGDLRGAGGARREVRYPHSGQRRPERCLRNALKRWGLRFWILRAAREPHLDGSKTAPGRRMRLAGTKDGGLAYLNESWKSKMEIPDNSVPIGNIVNLSFDRPSSSAISLDVSLVNIGAWMYANQRITADLA